MDFAPEHLVAMLFGSTAAGAIAVEIVKARLAARAKRAETAPALAVARIEADAKVDVAEVTGRYNALGDVLDRMTAVEKRFDAERTEWARERRECNDRIAAIEVRAESAETHAREASAKLAHALARIVELERLARPSTPSGGLPTTKP